MNAFVKLLMPGTHDLSFSFYVNCYIGGHTGKTMRGRRCHIAPRYEAGCNVTLANPAVFSGMGSNSCWEQPGIQWPRSRKIGH